MRKLGMNYEPMQGITPENYVKKVQELGFQSFFTSTYEWKLQLQVAELIHKYGLEYETIHAPFIGINNIWMDGEKGEEMYAQLADCVERCEKLGAGIMVVHLSSGVTPPPITDVGRERFEKLVDYAIRKNVKVAFENQRKLANLSWALETFENEDMVGFCWDCGHESCFSPGREYMPLFGKKLICTHIHDNEGIYNKDSHLIPFDGNIDFERFAQHVKQSGYAGPLTLEVISKNSNCYDNISPEEYLEKAYAAIKRLASMIDE